jgi:hypothetical protein
MATPKTGRWQVTTETSVYLLDLAARQLIRVPDAGTGNPDGPPPIAISSLRRDHEPVALLRVLHCELGAPMQLVLDIRRDGIPTLRATTCVRDLRELDTADDPPGRSSGSA